MGHTPIGLQRYFLKAIKQIFYKQYIYMTTVKITKYQGNQDKDEDRKQRYLKRHENNENWKKYMSAGALSRYVLWNKPNLQASISDYKRKFNLK